MMLLADLWEYRGETAMSIGGEAWRAQRGSLVIWIRRKGTDFRVAISGEWPEEVVYPEYPDQPYSGLDAAKEQAERYAMQYLEWLLQEAPKWSNSLESQP